jgi:hypothetical protein
VAGPTSAAHARMILESGSKASKPQHSRTHAVSVRRKHCCSSGEISAFKVASMAGPLRVYNGLTFTGRPGTDQLSNHEDRSAGPVQCNVGLYRTADWPSRLEPIGLHVRDLCAKLSESALDALRRLASDDFNHGPRWIM